MQIFFFFVNGTNIKKNHTTVWIIYSIKISVEIFKNPLLIYTQLTFAKYRTLFCEDSNS